MKLKPEAAGWSAGADGYMKLKPLYCGSSVEEAAAGYIKPKAEGALETGSSSC